jgi:hypothetical protein
MMIARQITVLTGNSAKRVGDVFFKLSEIGIDIRAHCLVDNGDGNCKLRMVVSEPGEAERILQENRYAVVANDVVLVETDDRPGGLSRLLKLFASENIRIEYSYTAASEEAGIAVMVFRFTDNRAALEILKNKMNMLRTGLRKGF